MSFDLKKSFSAIKTALTDKTERKITLSPTVLVLSTYVLLLLSKIIDLTFLKRENEYFAVVILQLMIFLLPGAVWCKFSGERYLSGLRLKPPKLRTVPLILSASFVMASGGLLIAILFGGLDSLSGNFSLYDTFISKDDGTVPSKLYLLLAYAALPALCEEFVYRGILCREYERGGVTRAIVLSSLFFALLHFNLANLPIYLFAGCVLAMTLYATRSLFGAVIAHFLYNIFGLFGQPYMSTLYSITGSRTLFIMIVGLIFLISAAVFCGEASRLYKKYLVRGESARYRTPVIKDPQGIKSSYIDVIKNPSAIACFAVYIIALLISFL